MKANKQAEEQENLIVPSTTYHKLVNVVCLLLIGGTIAYLALAWSALPDLLPGHYNAAGEVDRMGSKIELILLPILNTIFFLGIGVIERRPSKWNTSVTVTNKNRAVIYRETKSMIVTLKLELILDFTYLTFSTIFQSGLGGWFTPVVLFVVFGTILFFGIRIQHAAKRN